jgi:transcription elongation factor Elf1
MTSKVDMKGKTCVKCKKGKYNETSIQDDMHGVLHCDKCGHETKRWAITAAK